MVAYLGNTPDDVSHSVRGDNNIRSVTLHNSMDGDYSRESMFYGGTNILQKAAPIMYQYQIFQQLGTGDFTIEAWNLIVEDKI